MHNVTLQVAAVSVEVGVEEPSAAKHVASVVPAVHLFSDPHLHIEPVHILLRGAAHVAPPHVHIPDVHVSVAPVQATTDPHMHIPEVQVLEDVLEHTVPPHVHAPELQVSVTPEQASMVPHLHTPPLTHLFELPLQITSLQSSKNMV